MSAFICTGVSWLLKGSFNILVGFCLSPFSDYTNPKTFSWQRKTWKLWLEFCNREQHFAFLQNQSCSFQALIFNTDWKHLTQRRLRDVSGRWEESLESCAGKNISTITTRLLLFISETSLISSRSQITSESGLSWIQKIWSVSFRQTTKDQIQVAEGQKKSDLSQIVLQCQRRLRNPCNCKQTNMAARSLKMNSGLKNMPFISMLLTFLLWC